MKRQLIAALVLAAFANLGQSQDVRQYRVGDHVDPREVARILGQPKVGPAIRTRSLRVVDDQADAQPEPARDPAPDRVREDVPQQRPTVMATAPREERARPAKAPAALSLPVQFRFDSADILPQARAQLDALADGLKMLPPAQRVVIEGHTDGVGSDGYNLDLSNRRAIAVRRYLVSVHQIDGARLVTEGYGKYRPLNADDPSSGENRRVQFRGG